MATGASSGPVQRFGSFEVDPRSREFRRKGTRIRMQDQPLEVLIALLERKGEVVTRDELKQRLWPAGTFVDADDGLNTAIRKLREVLGDSAERPVYIETIPRRGYRFIGTIEDQPVPSSLPDKPAIEAPSQDRPESRHPQPVQFRWNLLLSLVAAAALAICGLLLLQKRDYFWRNPVAGAQFQSITDIEGIGQAAAISRDGHFVAFLSDRDGQTDVWVTQIGSGQFHNLTHGAEPDIANPSLRTLSFSPDGSLVTFWVRKRNGSGSGDIGVWAVPTLGGELRPYLEGVAEFDWSPDGSLLAYHTPASGDPLFIANGTLGSDSRKLFTAPEGMHSHFPLWSADKEYIYFVQGTLPDKLDVWRIPSSGGTPQRITSQNTRLSYPVLLGRTLLYLASDPDGSGPWLYGMDVQRRIPHKLASSLDHYTSLALSADTRRLVVTHGATKKTLWRLQIDDSRMHNADAVQIPLTTASGFSPRLGPDYLLYVSAVGAREGIWKLANGASTELWSREGSHILGAPAIAPNGQRIAVSVQQQKRSCLYIMQVDGAAGQIVTDALELQGAPAWSPDGDSIIVAANDRGVPHLFRVPIDGSPPTTLVPDYSVEPASEPNGRFVLYSGPDVGATFTVKSVTPAATPYPLPPLNLTRGARHMAFVSGGQALVFLRGEVQHKDIWTIDLKTGIERQLTRLPADFDVRDFDISPDGREIVLERVQELSEVALLDLPRP